MSIEVHYGGVLKYLKDGWKYVDGQMKLFENFDTDTMSWFELRFMLKQIGFVKDYKVRCLRPRETLNSCMELVQSDADVMKMLGYLDVDQNIVLYIEQLKSGTEQNMLLPDYCLADKEEQGQKDVVPTALLGTISPGQIGEPIKRRPKIPIKKRKCAQFIKPRGKNLVDTDEVNTQVDQHEVQMGQQVLESQGQSVVDTQVDQHEVQMGQQVLESQAESVVETQLDQGESNVGQPVLESQAESVLETQMQQDVVEPMEGQAGKKDAQYDAAFQQHMEPQAEETTKKNQVNITPPSSPGGFDFLDDTPLRKWLEQYSLAGDKRMLDSNSSDESSPVVSPMQKKMKYRSLEAEADVDYNLPETRSARLRRLRHVGDLRESPKAKKVLNMEENDEHCAAEVEGDVEKEGCVEENDAVGEDYSSDTLHSPSVSDEEVHVHAYDADKGMEEVVFEVGMEFASPQEFREAVRGHAIKKGFDLFWEKNEGKRIIVRCREFDCPFRLYSSWNREETRFLLKSIHAEHSCGRFLNNRQVTKRWLMKKYLENFRSDPNMKWKVFRDMVLRDVGVSISKQTCYRVRRLAMEELGGKDLVQFALLRDYAQVLLQTNPGSHVKVKTKPITDSETNVHFEAIFVAFNATLKGLLDGCRPVIGMDGCHLSNRTGGIMLSAVSRDPNNQMFPVAYAVVEVENKETWSWFVNTLIDAVGVENIQGWTFITDRQKGFSSMADTQSVVTLIDSATYKLRQLQQAFSELEGHSAISLNLKWKQLEDHFHGLEKSLKKRFDELEGQEKAYVNKVSETQEMLERRETAVGAKELASLDRLQEKRDAVLSAIFGLPSQPTSNDARNPLPKEAMVEGKSDTKVDKVEIEDSRSAKNSDIDAKPRSLMVELCEQMDAKGLHEFISDNRKNLASIREEIPVALRCASNPFLLVLDSLKDFYSGEILGLDGKKDANLLGLRRTCLMLMESLSQLLTDAGSCSLSDDKMLTSDIKEHAKMIANEWKPKLDGIDIGASGGNSLEVHAFLQLLATFGISSEFNQEEICKLIPAVSRRRQTADLCCLLGIQAEMPGVVESLVNSGRQIEGVNLAYAFELTSQFSPVPLLKAYLKEVRKMLQVKAGNMSPGVQNEMNERELSALKAVIKCIEAHKLEEQYPLDPLQKRILQLEKAKADKRRAAEAAKPQSKRPRANGSMYSARVTSFPQEKSFYRTPDRYPFTYERQYMYPTDTRPTPPMMASATYMISPTHTTYYGNGYQVQYQSPYIH